MIQIVQVSAADLAV